MVLASYYAQGTWGLSGWKSLDIYLPTGPMWICGRFQSNHLIPNLILAVPRVAPTVVCNWFKINLLSIVYWRLNCTPALDSGCPLS